jgi:PAS domain S-box-containing protein
MSTPLDGTTTTSEAKFQNLILQVPLLINTFIGPSFIVETINKTALEIWGKSYGQVINRPLFDSSPELGDELKKILTDVYTTGQPFIANEIPLQLKRTGKPDTAFFNTVYEPLRDLDNKIYGIIVIGTEVTEAVNARKLNDAKTLLIHNIYMNAPASICTFKGPKHIYELVNPAYQKLFDKRDLVGKEFLEALPEMVGQGVDKILDNVYNTGEIYTSTEVPVMLARTDNVEPEQRYFNTTIQPIYDETQKIIGVVNFGYDVTEQIMTRKNLEASEKRFSNILEQSLMAIQIFKGPEMRITFMNEPIIVLYGKGRDVIGKTLLEVLPEMKDQPFPKLLDDVYKTGVPYYGYEAPGIIVRNGKPVETYFNFVYQPYREVDNSITGITVIGNDVGPQVIAKKQILESGNQFRTFADSIQNLAWIANADGWVYWYNQRWYDYTGTTLEEMEGWGWEKLHHPDHAKEVTDFLKKAWKKDEAFELTFPLRRYDGEYRWFLTRAYPVKDSFGKTERWIGTNTDINEQKTAEQKKDEFISIASHEMKTPLTTAKGYIELLLLSLEEKDPIALYATKANQAIERLNDLVTELLDSSKIQNGELDYNITTFDFNKLVEETIENFQLSAKNHRIQKTGNCSRQITADRGRLQQVLINLLSNGVKYSPKADKLLVKIEEKPGTVEISVQDFGVGMSAKHLDKIFERYYRVEEHAVHFQGLGIGLYISKNIIERHQGTMWAESEPGKGSIFYFTLPL